MTAFKKILFPYIYCPIASQRGVTTLVNFTAEVSLEPVDASLSVSVSMPFEITTRRPSPCYLPELQAVLKTQHRAIRKPGEGFMAADMHEPGYQVQSGDPTSELGGH